MGDRMKFEKLPDGTARLKPENSEVSLTDRLGRPPTAEDLIRNSAHPDGPPRPMHDMGMASRMVQAKADYKSRSRAEALMSRQVTQRHSPSARLKIKTPADSPFAFRWCYGPRREKVTMKGWEPVTNMELARKICSSAHLRLDADGKIYSGDSFLCQKPKEDVEDSHALYFQRSQRNMSAAASGQITASRPDGSDPGDASSFEQLHKATRSADDPVGVRMSVQKSQGLLDE